ncbi:MAG: sulfatase-like hydrolase/transferase [Muribaculaceae bacterium]|nr:sulfatase-like hydrolase/transferase [Muribaculaceae bacterium]
MYYNKIIYQLGKYWNAIVWYASLFLCLCLEWWLIKWNLKIEYTSSIGTFLKAFGDSAFILALYWLLAPKWRWAALIPVWLCALWGMVNIAYYRFWGDLIPPASVTMGGNIDGNLMEYGISLLHPCDVLFLLIPSTALIIYFIVKPYKCISFTIKYKIILFTLSIITGLCGQFSYFKSTYSWRNSIASISIKEALHEHFFGGYSGQEQLYTYHGAVYYGFRFLYEIFDIVSSSIDLTNTQAKEIETFLHNYSYKPNNGTMLNLDSLNVVYIIVESLNSDMLHKSIGGMKVMPFLNSLATAEGTVLFDNVVSQTKASSSSDGHLLLMTGLLPPEKISYSITYGSKNTFPSIADILPDHHKYLLLADEGTCWNEGNTLRRFGLGEPLAIKDRHEYDIEILGKDGAMFRQAADMMKDIQEPFFMTLMTISMHVPFKENAWDVPDAIEKTEGLSRMEKDYANMCHHTDAYIKYFLESLPENTLIFIASDHSQHLTANEGEETNGVFMAVNCGRTAYISRVVWQVNIFPATIDILGRSTSYGGLAPSAFNPAVDGTIDSYGKIHGNPSPATLDTLRKAYEISDLIIRSDYFVRPGYQVNNLW